MSSTTNQDKAFQQFVRDEMTLPMADNLPEFVADNFRPIDIYDLDTLVESIRGQVGPGDLFSDESLGEWAEAHGYVFEVQK